MRSGGRALAALTLLVSTARVSPAQDTTVAMAGVRHVLTLDTSKVLRFRRSYEVFVQSPDSSVGLGQREVVLDTSTYSGAPAWLLVETRGGLVPVAESLYLARDMRPMHWSSVLGVARLAIEFVGDSLYGATSGPMGKHNIVLGGRPDILVSGAMVELLLSLLPLTVNWTDSVAVLSVDLGTSQIVPAELSVVGEEQLMLDSLTARPAWVVTLRAGDRHILYWIDKETGAALRMQQPLPSNAGSGELAYRIRPESTLAPDP
jgi:hypothetical protein